MRLNKKWATALVGATLVVLAGCSSPPTPAEQDAANSAKNTGNLITKQPVEAGNFSPTRDGLGKWTKTWMDAPGKTAYTYIFQMGNPAPIGYYVLQGPPISYAANASQPYRPECHGSTSCVLMANPSQDGAFYNQGAGGNQFYGFDAQTGRVLEWGGDGLSYFLSDRPLRLQAPPLGDAVAGQGKLAGR